MSLESIKSGKVNNKRLTCAKTLEVSKPFEPFVVNENKGSGADKSSDDPSARINKPSKHESLGQNQLAKIVAGELLDCMVWDTSSGQWFERAEAGKPFKEQSAEDAWKKIRDQIEIYQRKFSASTVSSVERFLRSELTVLTWNNDQGTLPVANGVLDLNECKLRDYQVTDRFNWQVPYRYDVDAECPLIERTLERMVGENAGLVSFLYAWLSVVLFGRYDVQAFLELIGTGGTGKSTFLRLLAFLVGDENVRSTNLSSLEKNQFETASLYGKRLAVVTDSSRYRGDVPVLKAITGGDHVRLERKHQQQRQPFVFTGLVAIAANQPLESSDYTSGLSRRRRAIEFDYKVSVEEKKPYQDRKRFPNGFEGALQLEMSGLLNKLLSMDISESVNLVINPGSAMRSQALSIELETNPLLAWANENLVECSTGETRIGDLKFSAHESLYSNYCQYIEDRGQKPLSLVRFSRVVTDSLKTHGVRTVKHRGEFTILTGLRLRTLADNESGHLLSLER